MIVIGGFLIGLGTRYAKGCITNHTLMGVPLLSLNAMLAVVGIFIGGLTMTHFILPYILAIEY